MNSEINWVIPPSVLKGLEKMPADRPVVVLLRHSVRGYLPPCDAGYDLPITEDGVRLARELGAIVGERLKSLHASPILRCVQTARALSEGAGASLTVNLDRHLGDPGVYVLEGANSIINWHELKHEGVMSHLVSADEALPGMARPSEAARFLVHHMFASAKNQPGVHIFVTHDSLVTATAARLSGIELCKEDWPWYLEGAFFWRENAGVNVIYRENHTTNYPEPLCGFNENDAVEFAKREIALTVGLDTGARFFLAGGAFKTLLTGRPARDLDLWAPSVEDRNLLIVALEKKGAKRLPDRPFSSAYEISGRTVELPKKTEPATLSGRLARFDLALSAIGVEHVPDARFNAVIHPLAHESISRREVLLLKPLVNRNFILTTLERMRRYAVDLGFISSQEEEAEVWQVFDSFPSEKKAELVKNFGGFGSFNVVEEATRRSGV